MRGGGEGGERQRRGENERMRQGEGEGEERGKERRGEPIYMLTNFVVH